MTIEEAAKTLRWIKLQTGRVENEALDMSLSSLRAQQEKERNDPLTLDELREMVGEPVWTVGVSYTPDGNFSMWDIIESTDENGVQFGRSCENPEWWNYGLKTVDGKLFGWLAYRNKPEEGHK